MVDDNFLKNLGLEKGTRKVVNHEERGRVLQAMDGCSYKAAAGGSLSNTLVALARLASRSQKVPAINVAMTGSVGSDLLGGFYRFLAFSLIFIISLQVEMKGLQLILFHTIFKLLSLIKSYKIE